MEEKDSNIIDYNKYKYLIDTSDINKNDVSAYRQILLNQEYLTVVFNNKNSSSVKINNDISFGKIFSLAQLYALENIYFVENKEESMSISRPSDSKSISNLSRNINNINTKEELLLNNDNNNNYYSNKLNFDDFEQKHSLNKENRLTKLEIFFYYYIKILYIFYLLAGIIFFVYLIRIIIKYNFHFKSFYLWISFILVIAMLYLGYIGVSIFNGLNENINKEGKYDNDSFFWSNFGVLVLTILSFIFLIKENYLDNKGEKYIGIIIILFYLIVLLVEIIALIFFDLNNKIFDLKKNDGYILLESNEENEKLIEI